MFKPKLDCGQYVAVYFFPVILFFLVAGLILLNALDGLEYYSASMLLYLRGIVHILPLIGFLVYLVFSTNSVNLTLNMDLELRIVIVFLMMMIMGFSVIKNGPDIQNFLRLFITSLHILNLSILIPFAIRYVDTSRSIKILVTLYTWFLLCVCAFVIAEYVSGKFIRFRLGYPFIPGVYAYMCLIGLLGSLTVIRSHIFGVFFLSNIFMSGSRSTLILALLVYLFHSPTKVSLRYLILIGIVFGGLLLALMFLDDFSRPFLIDRQDLSSGRTSIWNDAVETIYKSPLLGHAKKITFDEELDGVGLAAHNSFLDLSLLYGLLYAVLAYVYWFLFILGFSRLNGKSFRFAWLLFLAVTAKSLISNIFWTNMGDGTTYLVYVLLMLLIMQSPRRSRIA
ncbi:MAG: O-antigen ligase family protein [Pseudomonadales bacterium]|nr:O-antigen ligase family protein [Pseudomonadales bacterium]